MGSSMQAPSSSFIFSKVRRGDGSQCVRFVAVSGYCLPASSNWFSLSGSQASLLAAAALPTSGDRKLHQSVASASSTGMVSLRYVPETVS